MDMFKTEWLLRIICSVAMGLAIGYERQSRSKEAGVRTHAIVAMASCLLMLTSKYGFADVEKVDASRIAAAAVSGIGFLGTGVIFVQRATIQGLTTAAGLWATSAIGLCFGAGMYAVSFFCGILMFILEVVLVKLIPFSSPRSVMTVRVHLKKEATAKEVNECLRNLRYNHSENIIHGDKDGGWMIETEITTRRDADPVTIISELEKNEMILGVEVL